MPMVKIIYFDLQLYTNAIRLEVKTGKKKNDYVFHMSQMFVAFTALNVLGNLTNGGGLDESFEGRGASDMYELIILINLTARSTFFTNIL